MCKCDTTPVPVVARHMASHMLRLWVRIPPAPWISVLYDSCVLSRTRQLTCGSSSTLRKQTMLVRFAVSDFFLFWICFKLTIIHLNCAVIHKFFNYIFKTYLWSIGSAGEASDAGIYFFVILFSFFYRHFDLEGSCSSGTKTRHVNLIGAGGS
jgi:hypothetical protein